jgi:predicted amidohydrolase YtcJ
MFLRVLASLLAVVLSFGGAACTKEVQPADLVIRGGKVVTMDPGRPIVRAVAFRGDTIVAIGSEDEIRPYQGPGTEVVELGSKVAVPGFIDSHAHFTGIGQARMSLNLMKTKSWDEIVAAVAAAAKQAQPGDWIIGRGWHQEKWTVRPSPDVEGFPVHDALSAVSPQNPVLLTHASGHASFVNAKALELAGITAATQNPPGGEILKEKSGRPTGLLRETASGLVGRARGAAMAQRTPEQLEADARREVELAIDECLSKGVTSLHDAGSSFRTVELYKRFADEGRLGVRLYVMLGESNQSLAQHANKYRMIGYGGKRLTVRAVKRLIDGALGPRGAWLLEPYADLPSSTGLNTTPVDSISETAKIALENDLQLCVHAIGDRANRETLNIYEAAFKAHPDMKNLRWRVEHAQHIAATDIPRFGRLGVIAAMQGIHCTSDAPYVLARLGRARAEEGAYAWQKLMRSGAIVSNGTDAPVEDVDPLASFYASVTRKPGDGSRFFEDQCMSREEALRSYTLSGAYAAFEEESKGSISPGKLADLAILSQDIMTVPEDQIPATTVVMTIVGGKVAFKK